VFLSEKRGYLKLVVTLRKGGRRGGEVYYRPAVGNVLLGCWTLSTLSRGVVTLERIRGTEERFRGAVVIEDQGTLREKLRSVVN
jgi:hypothetical protein